MDSSLRHVQTIAWAPRKYGCLAHLCTLHHGSPTRCVALDPGPVASRVLPDWYLTKLMLVRDVEVKNSDVLVNFLWSAEWIHHYEMRKRCHTGRKDELSSAKEIIFCL